MRLAVLSDIHSNLVAFEAVLADLNKVSPDAIVYLGDAVMKGPQPQECIDRLHGLAPAAIVRGNYDHMFTRFPPEGWQPKNAKGVLIAEDFDFHQSRLSVADQTWLANLPTTESLHVEGLHIDMFHAAPDSLHTIMWPWATNEQLMTLFCSDATNIALLGHVHHAYIRYVNGRLVVNAGSIGLPFDGDPRASYAVLDLQQGNATAQLRRVTYDVERAITVARQVNMPGQEVYTAALRHAAYPPY